MAIRVPRLGTLPLGAAPCPVREAECRRSPPRGWRRLWPRSPGAPRLPLRPTPSDSREDTELGLRSGGHRPCHSPGGRPGEKFSGAAGATKPRQVGLPIGRHSGPGTGPDPSGAHRTPAPPGSSVPGPLASSSTRPVGPPRTPATAPLGKQLLSRAEPRTLPRARAAPPSW